MIDFRTIGRTLGRDRHQNGSVRRTAGRVRKWQGHWYVYELVDGIEQRHHKSQLLGLCSEMRKGEAQDMLRAIVRRAEAAGAPMERQTVQQFVDRVFLPGRSWEANTRANYSSVLKLHIIPAIGAMLIRDVRKADVVAILKGMEASELSRGTIGVTRTLLHSIFSEAEDNKIITDNPVRRAKNPAKADTAPKVVLSLSEARGLLRALSGRVRLLFEVLLLCGLRIGEALALRWSDITPDGLLVDESVDRGGGTKANKTDTPRLVPLPPEIRTELAGFRATTYFATESDFIFGITSKGTLMRRQTADVQFLAAARRASGLKARLSFRICRRTFATLLKPYAATTDIQAILGHTTPLVTEQYYIQPVAQSQREATAALASSVLH